MADLADWSVTHHDAGEDRASSGPGTVVFEASYSPPPNWEPGPDGWLLDVELVEDLGPMRWDG